MATKKRPLNLRIDADLIDAMKIRAIQEKRTLSEMIEEFFRAYLKHPVAKMKSKPTT